MNMGYAGQQCKSTEAAAALYPCRSHTARNDLKISLEHNRFLTYEGYPPAASIKEVA
jgi:hypothetical protein